MKEYEKENLKLVDADNTQCIGCVLIDDPDCMELSQNYCKASDHKIFIENESTPVL
jgi:hypothetical protein